MMMILDRNGAVDVAEPPRCALAVKHYGAMAAGPHPRQRRSKEPQRRPRKEGCRISRKGLAEHRGAEHRQHRCRIGSGPGHQIDHRLAVLADCLDDHRLDAKPIEPEAAQRLDLDPREEQTAGRRLSR